MKRGAAWTPKVAGVGDVLEVSTRWQQDTSAWLDRCRAVWGRGGCREGPACGHVCSMDLPSVRHPTASPGLSPSQSAPHPACPPFPAHLGGLGFALYLGPTHTTAGVSELQPCSWSRALLAFT